MKLLLPVTILICLFLIMAGPVPVHSRVIVLPFQVISPEKKDHQWLGRAISHYLTMGLEFNSIETIPNNRVHSLFDSNSINFPYHISKASGIKLSVLAGADDIVWGEVLPPEKPESNEVQVRGYIINLRTHSQKYLPLIKFDIKDLFAFQREMLELILKYFQESSLKIPALALDLHGYETFIKSLLLTDYPKKIDLLKGAYSENSRSALINLELAKCYLGSGDLEKAGHFLAIRPGNELLQTERMFLNGLLDLHLGNREQARKWFSGLLTEKRFVFEARNNLGIIRFQENRFEQAESHFADSLKENRDPQVFGNYIHLLIKTGQTIKAKTALHAALASFPDDENLIKLFSYLLARDRNRNRLVAVFRKVIPELELPISDQPQTVMQIKSPFEIQSCENLSLLPDIEKTLQLFRQGNRIEAIKNAERLLEINPFIPRLHRILSEIYQKQKNKRMEEAYSLSAAYLEN